MRIYAASPITPKATESLQLSHLAAFFLELGQLLPTESILGQRGGDVRFLQQMRPRTSIVLGLVWLITLAVVMNVSRVHAQGTSASVSGRVTDQSGGVIVDAEVEVKDVDRGFSTIVKTNREGFYSFPALISRNYLINVRNE